MQFIQDLLYETLVLTFHVFNSKLGCFLFINYSNVLTVHQTSISSPIVATIRKISIYKNSLAKPCPKHDTTADFLSQECLGVDNGNQNLIGNIAFAFELSGMYADGVEH